jgi:hypothetical protein
MIGHRLFVLRPRSVMRGLELLIRLSRRVAEERQLSLSQISRACVEAEAAIVAHENGLTAECEIAATDLDALAAFSGWARDAARRANELQRRRSDLAVSELAAQGALREAFIDLKGLELALDAARETAAYASRRRADLAADEREQIRRNTEAA